MLTLFDGGQKPLECRDQVLRFVALGPIPSILSARLRLLGDVYSRPMSPEFIAILAVAVALAGLILRQGQQLGERVARLDQRVAQLDQRLTAEIAAQRDEIAALRDGQIQLGERMARLEGMIETAFRLTPTEAA